MNTEFFKLKLFEQLLQFFLYGGGIFALFKVSLIAHSTRIFGFIEFYRHKKKLLNHPVFVKIDHLNSKRDISITVLDEAKKDIVTDLFRIEAMKIKQILKMNLKFLMKTSFWDYLKSYKNFNHISIINIFVSEYIESRLHTEDRARNLFTKNGQMTHENFNRLWHLYQEISHDYEITIYESINILITQRNCYLLTYSILDKFNMLIEIIYKTMGNKFNRLNGRSYGIEYKGKIIGGNQVW